MWHGTADLTPRLATFTHCLVGRLRKLTTLNGSQPDTGFRPFASTGWLQANALLSEVPQSISIINQRRMGGTQCHTMNESSAATPGVQGVEVGGRASALTGFKDHVVVSRLETFGCLSREWHMALKSPLWKTGPIPNP